MKHFFKGIFISMLLICLFVQGCETPSSRKPLSYTPPETTKTESQAKIKPKPIPQPLNEDDFSSFTGWVYDDLTSNPGAGFDSNGNFLLVNSWGKEQRCVGAGPVVYKTLDPPIDLFSGTFSLDFYLISDSVDWDWCELYVQLVNRDNIPVVEAGYKVRVGCNLCDIGCANSREFYLESNGIRKTSKNDPTNKSGVISIKAKSGAFKLFYNNIQQTSASLTVSETATKLRLGVRNKLGCELDDFKLDWIRLRRN